MAKQQQQKNAHVPKFGNWDNDGNVPYTLYFDNARKGKGGPAGGKMMNPNDPVENPEAFPSSFAAPSPNRSEGRTPPPSSPPAHHHERQPSDAPPLSPNPFAGSPYHRPAAGGEPPRRGAGGGGYSVEQSPSPSPSPLHPYSQSRADYSESSGYGLVANSVERSRAGRGGSRGNETPTRGSAVPKFGDWDSNPASADGYTHIFNKVREEKQTQGVKTPGFSKDIAHGNGSKQHDDGYASSLNRCITIELTKSGTSLCAITLPPGAILAPGGWPQSVQQNYRYGYKTQLWNKKTSEENELRLAEQDTMSRHVIIIGHQGLLQRRSICLQHHTAHTRHQHLTQNGLLGYRPKFQPAEHQTNTEVGPYQHQGSCRRNPEWQQKPQPPLPVDLRKAPSTLIFKKFIGGGDHLAMREILRYVVFLRDTEICGWCCLPRCSRNSVTSLAKKKKNSVTCS